MRFFVSGNHYTYPDDASELRAVILKNSIEGPQKIPFSYFQKYFEDGGTSEHPLLGDLNVLIAEINRLWVQDFGANLVSGFINAQLDKASSYKLNI